MKNTKLIFMLMLLCFTNNGLAADNSIKTGKQLFNTHCSSCHGITGGMDMSKRIAPPIAGVRMHYISSYTDKLSFVNAIADWVESPDKSKSLMPGAIRRFKLMPKISVSRADAETIASYIYKGDIESPAGMKKHIEKMHGKSSGM